MGDFLKHYIKTDLNPYEVDPDYKAHLMAINQLLDKTGMYHLNELGYPMEKLKEKALGWALYQRDMHILKDLNFAETYKVETKITGRERIFTYRDYTITNNQNEICVESSSRWLLFDLEARKFVKQYPEELLAIIDPGNSIEHHPRPQKLKFSEIKNPELVDKLKIRYSEIDMNGHLSNHHHIRYFYDLLSMEWHKKNRIVNFSINYIAEASYGETIELRAAISDNEIYMISLCNDKVSAKAKLNFNEKKSI